MQSNLDISIGADTSRAQVDIELLKAKVRDLNKEIRNLSTEAQRSGTIVPRLPEAIAEAKAAQVQIKGLTAATRDLTVTNEAASLSLAQMGKMLGGLSKAAGLGIPGIKALRFGIASLAGVAIVRSLGDVIDRITDLVNLSKDLSIDTKTIQGFQQLFAQTGGNADDATNALKKFAEAYNETRQAQLKAGVFNQPEAVNDFQKALEKLNITARNFKAPEALFRAAQELVKLNDRGKIDDANILSLQLFGLNFARLEDQLRLAATSGNIDALIQKLGGLKGELTPEAAANTKAFNIAVAELNLEWQKLQTTLASSTILTFIIQQLNGIVQGIRDTIAELEHLVSLFKQIPGGSPATAPTEGATPVYASGGMVNGPGSGTSDSILARLSNGEFVMRAAAVRHWGPALLAAMNRAADGLAAPLVPRTSGRFAMGGLVAGGPGGAPVHLHLDGQEYVMRADQAVADSLMRTARAKAMLSAGRKPGWAGGRRYGG